MKNKILIVGLVCLPLFGCNQNQQSSDSKAGNVVVESLPVQKLERQDNIDNKAPMRPALNDNTMRSTLVGTWVLLGDDCQSGNGLIFAAGGKYASETEEGDWALEKQDLKIRAISHEGETGIHPINWNVKILDIDENTAILQRDDGSNMQWSRCKSVPKL